jgi:hypothetical protein
MLPGSRIHIVGARANQLLSQRMRGHRRGFEKLRLAAIAKGPPDEGRPHLRENVGKAEYLIKYRGYINRPSETAPPGQDRLNHPENGCSFYRNAPPSPG